MPGFEQNRITTKLGESPRGEQIRPNQLHQTSVRANFTFALAPNATLDLSGGYQDRDLWTPFDGTFFQGLSRPTLLGPGIPDGHQRHRRPIRRRHPLRRPAQHAGAVHRFWCIELDADVVAPADRGRRRR